MVNAKRGILLQTMLSFQCGRRQFITVNKIYLIWQKLLNLQFRLAEKHILLEWEECLQEVEAHQIR